MPKISRLDVRGFRGILNQRSLIFDGKSVLLFGENGTGKSSFADALEWLFTGRLTTLDGRAQELSSQRHAAHIRSTAFPFVSVTFAAPENATIDSIAIPNNLTTSMEQYLAGAREDLYIMRRSQLSRFIESQPRDRYALLRPFMPLGGIDELENTFRSAVDLTTDELRRLEYRADRLVSELGVRFDLPSRVAKPTEADLASSLSKSLDKLSLKPLGQLKETSDRIKDVDTALSEFGDLSRQSALLNGIRAVDQVRNLSPIAEIEAALNAINALRERETQEATIFYENVLEQGSKWIQEGRLNKCPLCEQSIDADVVVSRARERLREMQEIIRLRSVAAKLIAQAREAVRATLRSVSSATEIVSLIPETRNDEALPALKLTLATVGQDIQQDINQVDPAKIHTATDTLRSAGRHDTALDALDRKLKQTLNLLPSQERARELLGMRQRLLDATRLWSDYEANLKLLTAARSAANAAEAIYRTCQAARKDVVQSLYDELSAEINRIYVTLHPGERHGGIHIGIREAVQGSAYLRGNFYDRTDEDVRAYYSEAHLDTLGLSIFLALRVWHRRMHPNFDLLVLDDVLTSVDAEHLVRVSEFLLREFSDYQILLTTHDRIWFEHLRDIQNRCRVSNRFVNKVIHKWTVEDGPDLREPEDERQDLELRLKNGEPKDIASTAGRLLEHILQEMRYNFRLRIGARRGELYEIGEMWPAFYAEMRKNYPSLYSAAKEALDALDVRWPLRNWIGAHFNEWAARVSRESSMAFGKAVADLFDRLFCADCRRFVEPSATPLGQVACRCGARLYPVPGTKAAPPSKRSELVSATRGALKDARLDTNIYLELKKTDDQPGK